jgi:ribonuclease P/MRP protein subunit RPP40
VIISENLKPSLQCAKAAHKANGVLGQLTRGVSYRDKDCFMSLYLTYVRPHLEYAVAAWSPWNIGDKEILEAVQKRAVMMVTNLKGKSYSQRLGELGLTTLEDRRERGDLIQAYKILTGKEMVNYQTWFQMCEAMDDMRGTRLRGGIYNVERMEGRLEVRKNYWSVRVANKWNMLPDMIKSAKTVNAFKNGLDNWTEKEKRRRTAAFIGGT